MKEKCYAPLQEAVRDIKTLIGIVWDVDVFSDPKLSFDFFFKHYDEIKDTPAAKRYLESEKRKLTTRSFLESLDRKTLNTITIVMTIGKYNCNFEKPFDNPEKEFETCERWLQLEEKMPLGKGSHILYLMGKGPLKKYLRDGLYLLGVA